MSSEMKKKISFVAASILMLLFAVLCGYVIGSKLNATRVYWEWSDGTIEHLPISSKCTIISMDGEGYDLTNACPEDQK